MATRLLPQTGLDGITAGGASAPAQGLLQRITGNPYRMQMLLGGLGLLGSRYVDQANRYNQMINSGLTGLAGQPLEQARTELITAQANKALSGDDNIGTYNPRDYTAESWAKFIQSRNPADLERFATLRPQTRGGVPGMVNVLTGQWTPGGSLAAEAAGEETIQGAGAFGAAAGQQAVAAGVPNPYAVQPEVGATPAQTLPSDADLAAQTQDVKAAGQYANELFRTADQIDQSMGTLRDARQAVIDGAGTGPLVSAWPSFREASVRLDNIQNRAALDIIGATTFGALSKGELDLSKVTAIPSNLQGDALVQWIDNRIDAETAKANYLRQQAEFLATTGPDGKRRTQADWAQYQKGIMDRALESMNATEEDIKATMEARNMDRSSVLREIRRRYLDSGGS